MAIINLFRMHQERGQSLQNFHDQFTAIRQVCDQLGLHFGKTEQSTKAVLKRENVTSLTGEELKEVKRQP